MIDRIYRFNAKVPSQIDQISFREVTSSAYRCTVTLIRRRPAARWSSRACCASTGICPVRSRSVRGAMTIAALIVSRTAGVSVRKTSNAQLTQVDANSFLPSEDMVTSIRVTNRTSAAKVISNVLAKYQVRTAE